MKICLQNQNIVSVISAICRTLRKCRNRLLNEHTQEYNFYTKGLVIEFEKILITQTSATSHQRIPINNARPESGGPKMMTERKMCRGLKMKDQMTGVDNTGQKCGS